MKTMDANWWARARRAHDQLVAQVLNNPTVSMVDIGQDPDDTGGPPVLRVHVRQGGVPGVAVPLEMDGIPIRVIEGDYRPQS